MIVLYSTGCPQCKVLKQKLDDKGLEYTVVSDIEEMELLGFTSAPMLNVDGKIMNFIEANKWLKSDHQEETCASCFVGHTETVTHKNTI